MAKLDFYNKELANIQAQLIDKLDSVVVGLSRLNDAELIQIAKQINFFDELERLGYASLLDKVRSTYQDEIAFIFGELSKNQLAGLTVSSVDIIKDLADFELTYLTNGVRSYSDQLKNAMFRSVITGETNTQVIQNLRNGFGVGKFISSSEASFLINDAFATFSNATRAKVFQDFPDVRFKYVGPKPETDDKVRPACRKVFKEVAKRGPLTIKEINALQIVGFEGFSRRGGYNCRHDWISV